MAQLYLILKLLKVNSDKPSELFLPISKAKNHKPISEALQGPDEIFHGKECPRQPVPLSASVSLL